MIKIIIKTVLIMFNLLLCVGASREFNEDNQSFAYIAWMFIELIIILVIL